MLTNLKSIYTPQIIWHKRHIDKQKRLIQKKQSSFILWFTGLSASGKSTIANELDKTLYELNYHSYLLDGDNIRHGLNQDLDLSDTDRSEHIRRIGEVGKLFVDSGLITLIAMISPFTSDRKQVRALMAENEFIEVFVDTPLRVCMDRDPKGFYKQAREGKIVNFTGIDAPYEKPICAEIHLETHKKTPANCVEQIMNYLHQNKIFQTKTPRV